MGREQYRTDDDVISEFDYLFEIDPYTILKHQPFIVMR